MKKRKKKELMKKSRKSEKMINTCMRHGDDHEMRHSNILSLEPCDVCKE